MASSNCPHCHAKLPPVADAFCAECGERVDEPPVRGASGRAASSTASHHAVGLVMGILCSACTLVAGMLAMGEGRSLEGALLMAVGVVSAFIAVAAFGSDAESRATALRHRTVDGGADDMLAASSPSSALIADFPRVSEITQRDLTEPFRYFMSCQRTSVHVSADMPQPADRRWLAEVVFDMLRDDGDFVGVVDTQDNALHFMLEGGGVWMEIPMPERGGSYGRHVALEDVSTIIRSLPVIITPNAFDAMTFRSWEA